MTNTSTTLLLAFLLGLGFTNLYAQEVIPSSGGEASAGEGSVSYSVGQIVYTIHNGSGATLSQGVQQPYEISVLANEEETAPNLSLFLFPNPSQNNLTLEVKDFKNETLSYQLLDMQGKLLENNRVTNNLTQINMVNFLSGTYLLQIAGKDKILHTFKIIKN